jgi:hypothetical protein
VTIDSLINEGATPPSLIKIDVEGAEHLVLAGASSCLMDHAPTMIIETLNVELMRRLSDMGYKVFQIDADNALFVSARAGVDFTLIANVFPEYETFAI